MIDPAVSVSRLPVGSSAHTIDGLPASARAIVTRCCSPPDSSLGRWFLRWPSPTRSSVSSASPACLSGSRAREQQRQLDVLGRREHRDQVEALEDETHLLGAVPAARWRPTSGGGRGLRPEPCPSSMSSRPDRQLRNVVLPDPDGPMTARNSPRAIEIERSFRASTVLGPGLVDLADPVGHEDVSVGWSGIHRGIRPSRLRPETPIPLMSMRRKRVIAPQNGAVEAGP